MSTAVETRMPLNKPFAEIYEENHRRVLILCRHLLKSAALAEDAAHDVFLKAQAKLGTYDPVFPISSWLLRIASNHCIDVLRRRARESRLFRPDALETFEPASKRPGPLGQLLTNERGRDVRRALEALPGKYRVPLVLAYYCEFSYDEIGAALGVNRNTVASLLFRGKRLLRKSLTTEVRRDLSK